MYLQDFSDISDVKNVRCGKSSDEIYGSLQQSVSNEKMII